MCRYVNKFAIATIFVSSKMQHDATKENVIFIGFRFFLNIKYVFFLILEYKINLFFRFNFFQMLFFASALYICTYVCI